MAKYICLFLFSVFISSVSQIILKSSTKKDYESIIEEYLNPKVIFAYGMFFVSSLLTIFAYKYVPLSLGPVLEASGYIYVTVLGYIFLNERLNRRKIFGLVIILFGIVVSNM